MVARRQALTPKQLAYALARIEGMKIGEATRAAREAIGAKNTLTPGALQVEGSRLENHAKVRAYIEEARQEMRLQTLLTRDKKRMILGGIAQDRRAPHQARIMAVRADNEMTGDNAPVRVEGEITLHAAWSAIREAEALPMGDKEVLELPEPVGIENGNGEHGHNGNGDGNGNGTGKERRREYEEGGP